MVGGRDMVLDIDAHILRPPAQPAADQGDFPRRHGSGVGALHRDKPERREAHHLGPLPLRPRGASPSCILIDIDYPQWHTLQDDPPSALSAESLGITEAALLAFSIAAAGVSRS